MTKQLKIGANFKLCENFGTHFIATDGNKYQTNAQINDKIQLWTGKTTLILKIARTLNCFFFKQEGTTIYYDNFFTQTHTACASHSLY